MMEWEMHHNMQTNVQKFAYFQRSYTKIKLFSYYSPNFDYT